MVVVEVLVAVVEVCHFFAYDVAHDVADYHDSYAAPSGAGRKRHHMDLTIAATLPISGAPRQ